MKAGRLEEIRQGAEKELGKKIVFSDGDPDAKIMIVGEAPGRNEEEQGRPFVGAAGKLLNKTLEAAGLSRKGVYITNIVLWRPPDNRKPTKEEMEMCRPYMTEQLKIVKPVVVCTLGNTPLEFFTGNTQITKYHGVALKKDIDGMEINLFPTFHPAAIIYNRKLQKLFEDDMKKLKSMV